ncbi:alpha/beta hydrolase [Rhizobium bangladeshense]|uniref:alpha/beta hydrolase n=1 Tax=Rhizobium bangladeshense TaxID=1138189 RepID=UPI001C82A8BA|nr:alpha/beta hydrolase [Rhizobium bangladeshense]MBX4894413.1 alpha/beta hydrolase [Rhizobium bangladeshense]MBX4900366.1 alpha/beta hydrolase [Rhizobium bangladeshense]MBX4912567.1 alpha/beta hydrolase [Rhizobium bangladeshense]MBY3611887.1 alpha/beta hydrolase [Rhizobium bangladeshense]
MASRASAANRRHYEALAASPQAGSDELTNEQIQHRADLHWSSLTAEPGSVDYSEVTVAGRRALWIVPEGSRADQVLFYVHGGGFVGGSIYSHRKLVGHLASAAGTKGLLVSYPMSQTAKFPAQQRHVRDAYKWLLKTGCPAEGIVVGGDSAGVGALFGGLLLAKQSALPMPAAALSISGWVDFTQSGRSYQTNRERDAFFQKPTVDFLASLVLGGLDAREASPLFADLTGMPPTYLQVGEHEALLDDSVRFAEALKAAGVETRIDIFPEMLHSFQMMAGFAPEADDAITRFAGWVRPRLAQRVPPER